MKTIRKAVCGLAIGMVAINLLPAQEMATPDQSIQSLTDLNVMLQALEATTPMPAASLPRAATFWSAQHAPGSPAVWPPLPSNFGLSAWPLGDGVYLLNDTNVNYAELAAAAEAAKTSAAASSRMSMSMMAQNLAGYAYGNPVYLTNVAAIPDGSGNMIASFNIAGGTNFVPYDILMSTNVTTPVANWNWLGVGYTSNHYTFHGQPTDWGFYLLAKPSKTMVVPWGDDTYGQCDLWSGITNALQVTGGIEFSLALLNNGTVVGWGYDGASSSELVPTNLIGVTMITSGWQFNVALLTNGTVTAWGADIFGELDVPTNLINVTVISAQALNTLALCSNGTVVAWGDDDFGQCDVPSGLTNVTAIAAGGEHSLAVSNGIVVAWGDNAYGQCDVPAGLSNVVDVAASGYHSLALLNNGTVVAWGDDSYGETNVPAGLSNVVMIAAGGDSLLADPAPPYSLALKSDGTVVAWGSGDVLDPVEGLTNVISIGGGVYHALAVRTGPATPVITLEPTDEYQVAGGNATFTARGAGLYGVTYQWQTNGVNLSGATNATLILTNVQAAQLGVYDVVVTDNAGMGSLVSSNANFYLVTVPVINSESLPTNQTVPLNSSVTLNVSASAPGQFDDFPLSYQWQFDGTNISEATSSNYTFSAVNSGTYSVIVSNAAGSVTIVWQVNVVYPGGVIGWGDDSYGQCDAPAGLTNATMIATGEFHSEAVKDDGTVAQWGYDFGEVPADLTNAVAVAAGYEDSIALRSDGTVVAWGADTYGETNIPASLSGVKAVTAGWEHNVALLTNGTVVAWGNNYYGQTNVPADLTNVTAIAACSFHNLALKSDGTVEGWGYNYENEIIAPAGLSNVVAIAAGFEHSLALKADGTVTAWGDNSAGQCNVPAGLSNVMAVAAGWWHSVALKNDGTVVVWGDDSAGQTNVINGLGNVKMIAAAGEHTLAGIFSPQVMYPVDVTKDLLLIYNTNSTDSTTVLNYYLQNRPMVGGANVLGIGCSNTETIPPNYFTNVFIPQIQSWLTTNPTKRPQYVILFYDLPSRVNSNDIEGDAYNPSWPSVQYQISTGCAPDWRPFVTSINFNSTNDCIGYINKLAYIGTNYSPGKLTISASAGGYGNTNYVIDDVHNIYCGDTTAAAATNGLIAAGVPISAILYLYGCEVSGNLPHLTNAVNVTGYITWGAHSSLGADYPYNGEVQWSGNSGWWIIETIESFNGQREAFGQGNFVKWFTSNSFGGTNYSTTPVGGVSHTDEPELPGVNNSAVYFGLWASGKNLAICAWNSRNTTYFQALGDPFVTR